MSLILSGTDGLSDVDGSAATPAIRGTDANTGMFFPAADTIAFAEGGAEIARFDSSGNLGIGTTSPATRLTVAASNAKQNIQSTTGTNEVVLYLTNTGGDFYLGRENSAGTYFTAPAYSANLYSSGAYPMLFWTNGTERARIDSSGNLMVGTTSGSERLNVAGALKVTGLQGAAGSGIYLDYGSGVGGVNVYGADTSTQGVWRVYTATSNGGTGSEKLRVNASGCLIVGAASLPASNGTLSVKNTSGGGGISARFFSDSVAGQHAIYVDKGPNDSSTNQCFVGFTINNQTVASGQINANGASQAAFGSWSDARLKENIVDLTPQLSNIMALRPVEFDYIESEGGGHQTGFIAQEMETVFPDAVGERQDGMKTVTGWGKTEARLVKAIQEQQAIIESLKARLDAANL